MISSKKIDKKKEMSIKELEKIIKKNAIIEHMNLVRYLYNNHLDIWREYEKFKGFKSRLVFVGGKNA